MILQIQGNAQWKNEGRWWRNGEDPKVNPQHHLELNVKATTVLRIDVEIETEAIPRNTTEGIVKEVTHRNTTEGDVKEVDLQINQEEDVQTEVDLKLDMITIMIDMKRDTTDVNTDEAMIEDTTGDTNEIMTREETIITEIIIEKTLIITLIVIIIIVMMKGTIETKVQIQSYTTKFPMDIKSPKLVLRKLQMYIKHHTIRAWDTLTS